MRFSTKFVCEDRAYSTYEHNVPAPLFRKSFVPCGVPERAEIVICGLGFYDLYVNGQKITKGYLAPYISNTDHYTYYDRYDLLPYLQEGENVIGIALGDGFLVGKTCIWNFKDNIMNASPMVALWAEIEASGKTQTFEADSFTCKKGPMLFNDLRSGVFYDARLEEEGWSRPGFAEVDWHAPLPAARPRGRAKLCTAEPIRVYREIKPVSITPGERMDYRPDGQMTHFLATLRPFEGPCEKTGYIYDFGENNAGIFRLKIKGSAGQKVSIQCCEQLYQGKADYSNIDFYPDGFSQRDIYYLKGEGEEIFEPPFTYHGYRYLFVTGITPEQATEDLLTYLVMSSDLMELGSFECSDPMANTLFAMGRRSDRSNFFYFPNDCPHREKNGWTGDASLSAEHMILTMDTEKSWREWLHNIRAAQAENGALPGIVPTDQWGYGFGGAAWDNVLFNLPYCLYRYRGNTDVIRENADAMLRYLSYVSYKRDGRGIVEYGLGDWLPVGKGASDFDAPLGFLDSVMLYDMCQKAAEMYAAVNLPLHRQFALTLGGEMYDAIRAAYIDFATYTVESRCQTAQAVALYYGLFTEEEAPRAFAVLEEIVHADGDSFTCGVMGLRVLFHVLTKFGRADLAYHMITKPDYPSYGNWVVRGETTFLEHFTPYGDFYDPSKNHHFFGDILSWFMQTIGGLQVQSADHVKVCPHFLEQLDYCRTTHKLPAGEIEIDWKRNGKAIDLRVKTTGDVRYEVYCDPAMDVRLITD